MRLDLVKLVENVLILHHVGRNENVHDWVGWPEGHGQHADSKVYPVAGQEAPIVLCQVGHVLLEGRVDIPGQLHVFEHSL